MKIVLNSVEDLQELIGVLDAEFLRTWQPGLHAPVFEQPTPPVDELSERFRRDDAATTVKPHQEGATVMSSAGPVDANLAEALGIPEQPDKDADGAPYNTDWHSDPAKLTAKDVWRARRGRDEAAYKDWLLSLAVETAEAAIAADDVEPVATETHALPQDEDQAATESGMAAEAEGLQAELDHAALIEASQEAAKDAPDGTIDLLNAGKEFIKEYGTAKFEALKSAVCPTEDGKGKSIPSMDPGERRLMRACMDNYALYL